MLAPADNAPSVERQLYNEEEGYLLPPLMSTYYGCIQLGFEDWFSTHAQSLILALFRWWWKDNSGQSGQTSNSGETSFNLQIIMDILVSIASISS